MEPSFKVARAGDMTMLSAEASRSPVPVRAGSGGSGDEKGHLRGGDGQGLIQELGFHHRLHRATSARSSVATQT